MPKLALVSPNSFTYDYIIGLINITPFQSNSVKDAVITAAKESSITEIKDILKCVDTKNRSTYYNAIERITSLDLTILEFCKFEIEISPHEANSLQLKSPQLTLEMFVIALKFDALLNRRFKFSGVLDVLKIQVVTKECITTIFIKHSSDHLINYSYANVLAAKRRIENSLNILIHIANTRKTSLGDHNG